MAYLFGSGPCINKQACLQHKLVSKSRNKAERNTYAVGAAWQKTSASTHVSGTTLKIKKSQKGCFRQRRVEQAINSVRTHLNADS